MSACVGFDFEQSVDRCFLNHPGCTTGTEVVATGTDLLRKKVAGCDSEITQSLWHGTEELLEDQGVKLDGLSWADTSFRIEGSVELSGEYCSDDDLAANFYLGKKVDEAGYSNQACKTNAARGACSDLVFKTLCPKSCNGDVPACFKDSDEAAVLLATRWGFLPDEVTDCRTFCFLGRTDDGVDVVVASVCKETCASPTHYKSILDPEDRAERYAAVLEETPLVASSGKRDTMASDFPVWPRISAECKEGRTIESGYDDFVECKRACEAKSTCIGMAFQNAGTCDLCSDFMVVSDVSKVAVQRPFQPLLTLSVAGGTCLEVPLANISASEMSLKACSALCATTSGCKYVVANAFGCFALDACTAGAVTPVAYEFVDKLFAFAGDSFPLAKCATATPFPSASQPAFDGSVDAPCLAAFAAMDASTLPAKGYSSTLVQVGNRKCEYVSADCTLETASAVYKLTVEDNKKTADSLGTWELCDLDALGSREPLELREVQKNLLQLTSDGPDPYDLVGYYLKKAGAYVKAGEAGPAALLTYEPATGFTLFAKRFGEMTPVYQSVPVYRRESITVPAEAYPVVQWYPMKCPKTDLAVKRMCSSIAGACDDAYVRCSLSFTEMTTFLTEYRRYPEGGRSLLFPRTGMVRSLRASCPAFLASDRFVGKIVHSERRVEVLVDIDKFGHHYAGVDLRPDERDVVFRSLGDGVGKALIVVASVNATGADTVPFELGVDIESFLSDEGYEGLAVPLVIRVERFKDDFDTAYSTYATTNAATFGEGSYYYDYDCGLCEERPADGRPCATVDAPFDFEIYPTVLNSIAVFRLRYGSKTELEPLSTTGGVVSPLPSGGYVVRARKDGDYVVLADKDECAAGRPCPTYMTCVNTVGSYRCECKPAYRPIGDGECAPALDHRRLYEETCEVSTISVRNAAKALGLRIREVSLHRDAECSRDASKGLLLSGADVSVITSESHDLHPPELLTDKKGQPRGKKHGKVTGAAHTMTEWWAAQHSADIDEMTLTVTPADGVDGCGVRSIAVFVDIAARDWTDCDEECWSRPDREMPLTPGPFSFSWAPSQSPEFPFSIPPTGAADTLRDGSGMNKFVQSWLVTEESVISQQGSVCLALECGTKSVYYQTAAKWAPEGTETACDCKQQCLDRYKEGCRAFQFRIIEDMNWDITRMEHVHGDCRLFDTVVKPTTATSEFNAGTIVIVDGVSSVTSETGGMVVTVTGIGLEVHTQRLKLILAQEVDDEAEAFVSAPDICAGMPPATVGGIACSNPSTCTPSASETSPTASSWKVTIQKTSRISRYVACHCLSDCADGDNVFAYAAVPGYVELPAAAMTWSHSTDESWLLPGEFALTLAAPDMSLWSAVTLTSFLQEPEYWRVKVVKATGNTTSECYAEESAPLTWKATKKAKQSVKYRATLSAGRYTVCACVRDEAYNYACKYEPISAVNGSKVIIVKGEMAARAKQGYDRAQRTSGSLVTVGQTRTNSSGYFYDIIRELSTVVDFSLTGWGLANHTPAVMLGKKECPGTINAKLVTVTEDKAHFSATVGQPAQKSGEPGEAGQTGETGDGSGEYVVCSGDDVVGRMTVTARAAFATWAHVPFARSAEPYDAGNYTPMPDLLSPEEMDGMAVEVQGYGITASDRIALLGENKTCGVDDGGSTIGLLVGGVQKSAAFEKWVPKVINGGGIEQMFVRVEGRACPNNERGNKKPNPLKYRLDPEGLFSHNDRAKDNGKIDTECTTTDESGAKVACPADLCLKKCYEDPAHVCAAVTIERDGVGCNFYSAICTTDSAASDKEKDTYFKRLPDGEVEDYYATQSNLTTLSFEPVALTHNRGAALKVCFCDSVLHPGCRTPADFDVELGRLHVSGTLPSGPSDGRDARLPRTRV
jgi:hypothetical protein